jgi:RimJ/RimL family protein N-acetyltransferase
VGTRRSGTLRWRIRLAWAVLRRTPGRWVPVFCGYWFVLWLVVLLALGDGSPGGMLAAAGLGFVLAGIVAVWRWSALALAGARTLAHPIQDALGVIDTERLVLRRPTRGDAAAFGATVDATSIAANGWTRKQARQATGLMRLGIGDTNGAALLVTDRSTGTVLGRVTIRVPHGDLDHWELGWSMGPTFRGRGYGTEAVGATFAALHALGVPRIVVGTATDNVGVHRVLDKLGAHHLGTGPHQLPDGTTIVTDWFAHDAPTPVR